jgi:2-hydroxy-6-oxonona-2,4-dienedioate hydrolase
LALVDEARYRVAEARLWASIGASPRERVVRLPTIGTRVRVQELGDGPPVLFIHGANTSGASWATLAAKLPAFRCHLVDRPGTGLSDPLPTRPDTERLIAFADAFVADVLDALGLASAHVVATSLGGFIALRGAAAHPGRLRQMVQFSWPAGAPVDHVPLSMRLTAIPLVARLAAAAPVSERTVRAIFRSVGHGPSLQAGRITLHDLDAYLALLRDTDTLRNELPLATASVSTLRGIDRRLLPDALLASIRTPTKFIWGGRDAFGGTSIAEALVARIRGAGLELLPDAGHAPWLDELDWCATSTAAFLAAA